MFPGRRIQKSGGLFSLNKQTLFNEKYAHAKSFAFLKKKKNTSSFFQKK